MAKNNKPVHKIRYGKIVAVIWENETDGRAWFNAELVRRYLDGDEWKETTSFGRDDLPVAALALNRAHAWICDAEEALRNKVAKKDAE